MSLKRLDVNIVTFIRSDEDGRNTTIPCGQATLQFEAADRGHAYIYYQTGRMVHLARL
jgi:hypothetical protein